MLPWYVLLISSPVIVDPWYEFDSDAASGSGFASRSSVLHPAGVASR
ncbi:MAG: hypothetical protein KKD27_04030 [Gammaproteobacteria bacterium]|nr:hypothetical protein [Stutzerimonas xanthomarina]MBU0812337.1 hypothetical protein [Gammaproteobacteria bacterium]MBU0852873.1 hypothetical protein [Gammaproteobacteria bacterium]MBU1302018.1 hypothetical protein [Gammaproteobacteria bacterium]MBU1460637.1 hypothetical protein [Gammaproteobacteria bacterium]MBU2281740.1 hypothetical protein [Gammaproteobacteria bacterium]|tara:strand:- start:2624 stop:2764 length:141 start_codon:yes stop_codon:yes gene_type:complete